MSRTNTMDHVFAMPEEAFAREGAVATYYMECAAGDDAAARAAGLAIGQTIGTWTEVPGLDASMLERHLGQLVALYETPPRELRSQVPEGNRGYVVQIAFPQVNFGAQLPLLLTALLGNDVSTSAQIKLLDISVSPGLAADLGGPRFGIAGIRERASAHGRPLLLNIIKPNIGFDAETGAEMFAEPARGGCDIVKDDELLGNTGFSASVKRVAAYKRAAHRVFEETGQTSLYCVNVTDRPDRMLEAARRSVELGADMIMINVVTSGFGALQAAAADPAISVPILAHYAGASSMTQGSAAGISSPLLLGKLMRLCGADASSFNSPYSVYPLLREKFAETARSLTLKLGDVRPSMPVPGGGIQPATAVRIVEELGNDVMLAVGGAIQGHPDGACAGAQAMRQAIDAAVAGIRLHDYAETHGELKIAIDLWGDCVAGQEQDAG